MVVLVLHFMCRKKLGDSFLSLALRCGNSAPTPAFFHSQEYGDFWDFRKNRMVGNTCLDILNFSEHPLSTCRFQVSVWVILIQQVWDTNQKVVFK